MRTINADLPGNSGDRKIDRPFGMMLIVASFRTESQSPASATRFEALPILTQAFALTGKVEDNYARDELLVEIAQALV